MCLLSNNVMDYVFVAQGKTTIPNVDDGEELTATDVRTKSSCVLDPCFTGYLHPKFVKPYMSGQIRTTLILYQKNASLVKTSASCHSKKAIIVVGRWSWIFTWTNMACLSISFSFLCIKSKSPPNPTIPQTHSKKKKKESKSDSI
jgi:hypothetical protein